MHNTTATTKSPKKFHVFHEWHIWKSPSVNKRSSPTENSVISASHPKQKPRVMRKAVRQSVHSRRSRQADPKETTTYLWITHQARNLIQRFQRHFGVCMQKPEYIAACGFGPGVHLFGTAALADSDNPIAEAVRQPLGAVRTRAIDHNNFRATGSLAQIGEKRAYQWRLVKNRNDNRDLH